MRGRNLSNLAPSARNTTARTAFDILLQICWREILVETTKFEAAGLKEILDFLTQNWATKKQKDSLVKSILERQFVARLLCMDYL